MKGLMLGGMIVSVVMLAGLALSAEQAQQPAGSGAIKRQGAKADAPELPAHAGTAKTATTAEKAQDASSKMVLKVGNQQVTESEMNLVISRLNAQGRHAVAAQARKEVGDQYTLMILLSQQAVDDHLEASPTFRQEMALHRLQTLAQAEYQQMVNQTRVTPEEVSQYYAAHQKEFEEAQVREAVVRVKPQGAAAGTAGLSLEEARARMKAIRKALLAGTDPKKMAQHFNTANDVMIQTESSAVRRGQLLPALEKAAFELKEGQISESVETPQALVCLQVVGRGVQELKNVSAGIDNTLRSRKVEAAIGDMKKKAKVWIDEEYFKPRAATNSAPSPGSLTASQTSKP